MLEDERDELRRRVAELETAERERSSRYQSFIEQTTDAVWCFEYDEPIPTDLPVEQQIERMVKATLVECNDVCAHAYGRKNAADAVGVRFEDLVTLEEESFKDGLRDYARNNYTAKETINIQTLEDGSSRYLRNNAQGIVENGHLVRVWGTFRDVTEQMQAKEALASSEARFRSLVESSPDLILIVDADRRIVYMNHDPVPESGLKVGDVLGTLAEEYVDVETKPQAVAQIDRALNRGEPTSYDTGSSLNSRRYHVQVVPLDAASGKRPQALLVAHDVTSVHRLAQEREMMLAELDHRVKNTLAMVLALANQTASRSPTLGEFLKTFDNRVKSVARSHEALASTHWSGVALSKIVAMTLGVVSDERCRLSAGSGDPKLPPRAVTPLAMVLHELTTNAVKHGALARTDGELEFRGQVDDEAC